VLTANDLAAIRQAQEQAMPDSCTIQRRTLTSDGMGGYTESWSDLATGVKCRLSPVRSISQLAERVVAEQFVGRTLWQLTLPAGQDVSHDDRVVVGATTYEVMSVNSGGAWEVARRVLLALVD